MDGQEYLYRTINKKGFCSGTFHNMIPKSFFSLYCSVMKKLLSLAVAVPCFISAVLGQVSQPSPTPTPNDDDVVKITTSLIQVDVTVTDGKGNIIRDLKPDEL